MIKTIKTIFQCPYFLECHGEKPAMFYSDNELEYEMGAIECKHPFLEYHKECVCRIVCVDDFDYDKVIANIKTTRRKGFKKLWMRIKREKSE